MDPVKEYSLLALIVGVFVALGWFGHHERVAERNAEIVANHKAQAKEAAHVAAVVSTATGTINDLQTQLATALAAPPTPHVTARMCYNRARNPVATNRDPAPLGPLHDTSGSGSGVGSDDLGLDIAPPTEAILKRDKAVIDYLQGYVRTCQTAGVCGK